VPQYIVAIFFNAPNFKFSLKNHRWMIRLKLPLIATFTSARNSMGDFLALSV
jgi:hypothetical protein